MGLSNKIKLLREQHNLTQSELGKIAGVSDKAVSTWENGSAEPRMGAIQRIADYFHLTICEILDESSNMTSPNESILLDMFRELNQEGQEDAIAYIRKLQYVPEYKKPYQPDLVEEQA